MGKEGARYDNELAIADRRRRVAVKYLCGVSQVQIGRELGVTQATISNDIKAIHAEWRESALVDFNEMREKELAALDHQLEIMWAAWERSCQLEQVRTRDVKKELRADRDDAPVEKGKKPKIVKQSMVPVSRTNKVVEKQLIGDPRWMAEITKVRELRAKILGLFEEKHQTTQQVNVFAILEEVLKAPPDTSIEDRLAKERALADAVVVDAH